MDADKLGHISYSDARTALEAWANQNSVFYDDDDLQLGRLIFWTF